MAGRGKADGDLHARVTSGSQTISSISHASSSLAAILSYLRGEKDGMFSSPPVEQLLMAMAPRATIGCG